MCVILDDYSKLTWTLFLSSKKETLEVFKIFVRLIQKNLTEVIGIRSDHGTEFKNLYLLICFDKYSIVTTYLHLKFLRKIVWLKERIGL